MSLEINEIGIRMRVHGGSQTSGGGPSNIAAEDGQEAKETINKEEIVDACVRRVLRALKTLQER